MTGMLSPDLLPPAKKPPPIQQTAVIHPRCYPALARLLLRHDESHAMIYHPLPAFALDASAWVHVDFYDTPPVSELNQANHKYAIWEASGDAYRVGHDGAVEDEPIYRGPRD